MNQVVIPHVPGPLVVPAGITEPTSSFRKQVRVVIGAILLFFLVYLVLVLLASALAITCIYAGIGIIAAVPKFITLMLGLGLAGLGLMVFFFIIKFIFAVSRSDTSGSVEVTEEEQPVLFEFIRSLAKETRTPLPKKIFISPDVNACVFYNSSFWSMFLPVRKNLQIGLGLVNTLSVGEFKAVVAHEFGHFSQRSMKLGSFVYNVNRIIFNMLFENRSYAKTLDRIAEVSGVFALFVSLTVKIVQGIQWILQQMYSVINKSYLGLSREMEFHADAVAVSVAGGNQFSSALRRVELADASYQRLVTHCNKLLKQKLYTPNVYPHQHRILQDLAGQHKLEVINGLPVVNDDFLRNISMSRITYQDQWASHPTLSEREKKIREHNVVAKETAEPAWLLFSDPEKLQEKVSEKLYVELDLKEFSALDKQSFASSIAEENRKTKVPEKYSEFFRDRLIPVIEPSDYMHEEPTSAEQIYQEIFTEENKMLPAKIAGLESDVQLLKAISEKQIKIKSFDYDGKKYHRSHADELLKEFEIELETMRAELLSLDKKFLCYLLKEAAEKSDAALVHKTAQVQQHFKIRNYADSYYEEGGKILGLLQEFFTATLTIEFAEEKTRELKTSLEPKFKQLLRQYTSEQILKEESLVKKLEEFQSKDYQYFANSEFLGNEVNELYELTSEIWNSLNEEIYASFRAMLQPSADEHHASLINSPVQAEAYPSILSPGDIAR